MNVYTIGEGRPQYAVVGCIHGDEPCGKDIIDAFRTDPPPLNQSIKLVVAHTSALKREDTKYLDEDLNRAFPGDLQGKTHEQRLAAKLLSELEGCQVLDLHSTVSQAKPFALLQRFNDTTKRLAASTGLDMVVDIREASGGLIQYVDGVSVECGERGSVTAVDNGMGVLENFLGNNGLLEASSVPMQNPALYRVVEPVPVSSGTEVELLCDNFNLVKAREPFARVDGETLDSEYDFYPVLMSKTGYEDRDILGFKAVLEGDLLDRSEFEALRTAP